MNDWSIQLYSSSVEEVILLEIPHLELMPAVARWPPWQPSVQKEFGFFFSSWCKTQLRNSLPLRVKNILKIDRILTCYLNWGLTSADLFIIRYRTFPNLLVAFHCREEIYLFFERGEKIYIITEYNIISIVCSKTKLRSCSEAIHAAVHFNLLG